MKKILGIVLTLALLIGCLAGCGSAQVVVDDPEAVAEPEVVEEVAPVENIKFGLITLHDENSSYDKNFIVATQAACEKLGVELVIKTNIPEGQECYDAAVDLADQGCDIIFADSFGHEPYMIEAAEDYSDVQFCHATGYQAQIVNLPNYQNAFAAIYEGRYLAGIVAGMKLNEMIENGEITEDQAVMGYVGAFDYAEVISGYTSFYLGARSVCPSVTMKVIYTGSWYDETLEKEGANALIGKGCVLISQHADSMGAPSACELAGVPDVSYNMSMLSACPNTYLVSSKINWEPYVEYIIGCVRDGEDIATDWTGTIKTGSVELTEFNNAIIADGTKELVDATMNAMNAGTLHVFDTSTFTVDGKPLEDDNYVFDGYFHESELGSAPAFAYYIDGITILD